jgi:hypothetical protein
LILQELLVPLKLDTSGFDGGIDRAITKGSFFGSFLGNIASSIAGGALDALGKGVERLGDFLGDAKEQASDLNESINAVNVVFEEGAGIIHEFGKTAATEVGMSNAKFNQLASVTGAFLTNLGMDAGAAADQTIVLTKRAADMASVFNTDVSQALQAIQSGLKGEFDPLEQFGVKLSAAAISAKAMEMGLADANGELDASAKSQAALALIMEQTNKLAGDFTNTSDSLANSQRIIAARMDDIKARIGTALAPALERLQKLFLEVIDSEDFGQIVDAVILGIEELSHWFMDNLPAAIDGAKFAWAGIKNVWKNQVVPVTRELIHLYHSVLAILNRISPSADGFAGKFTLVGAVLRIVVGAIGMLSIALQGLEWFLRIINGAIDGVRHAWERWGGTIQWIGRLLASLAIPWWLTPGSPTPLENGLRGVHSAMSDLNKNALPQFAAGLNVGGGGSPASAPIDYHTLARVLSTELSKRFG